MDTTLALNLSLEKSVLVYPLTGRLDNHTMGELDSILIDVRELHNAKGVALDCSGLDANTKGVGAIIGLKVELDPLPVDLIGPSSRLISTLRMFGVLDRFTFSNSIEESIAKLSKAV